MSTKPFKFRYVYEITGLFVFLCIASLCAMIFFASKIQGWFEPRMELKTIFSTNEGTFGLQQGNEVKILNTLAGSVSSITPNEEGSIEAVFEIKKAFHRLIRADSYAVVKKKFGLAGDAFVEIIPGNPKEIELESKSYIKTIKDTEIVETIKQVIEDLRKGFLPAIEKLKLVLEDLPDLIKQIKTTFVGGEILFKDLSKTLKNLDLLIEELRKDTIPSINNFGKTMEMLKDIIEKLKVFFKGMDEKTLQAFFNEDLPSISMSLEEALDQAGKVLEGAQKHWLLKKYVDKEKNEKNKNNLTEIGDSQ